MEEKNHPVTGKEKLTDENLEQVTGGIRVTASRAAAFSAADAGVAAATANDTATARVGTVAGAAILIGGAWAIIDHQQPSKIYGHHEAPMPAPGPDCGSR